MIKAFFVGLACLLASAAHADGAAAPSGAGELRIWASPADAKLVEALAAGFRGQHPELGVSVALHGPDSTMAGVVSGVADLALMPREMRQPVERMAFEWVHHHPALSIEIGSAGLQADRPSTSLAVAVRRDNPLTRLSLAQLDAILGAEHRRGDHNIRTWGELGLDGVWQQRAIHVYGPPVDSTDAMFIRDKVLKNSYKWNADYIEVQDPAEAAAAARDADAIAIVPLRVLNPGLKPLALAAAAGGPFVALADATAADRSYPLARAITVVLNRPPGQQVAPGAAAFLRYVLSKDGQQLIARDGAYLPLDPARAAAQLERLN